MRPPIVEVEWLDAAEDAGDGHKLAQIPAKITLQQRFTVGYLLHQCDPLCDTRVCGPEPKTITCRNTDPDGEGDVTHGSYETIPTGWIRSIRFLTRKPKVNDGQERTEATQAGARPARRANRRRVHDGAQLPTADDVRGEPRGV